MNTKLVRVVSSSLIVCMAALPLQASAGLIGATEATSAVQAAFSSTNARDSVTRFVSRDDVAAQLQAMGVSRTDAQARIAALTDAEVAKLAGQVDRLPAAADGSGIGLLIIAMILLWRFIFSDEAKAEAAKAAAPKEAPKK
jgi:hypothetical protein